MRRSASAVGLLLALAMGAGPVEAQEAAPLSPASVPAAGARAQDFVPRGWKTAARVDGDLNRDGRADAVLHLVPASTPDSSLIVPPAPETHALVVLLADPGGRLRRAGVGPRVLMGYQPQYGLDLAIRNGVLIVEQSYGMTFVVNLTHRFRYDPAARRFLLIGKDSHTYTRPLDRDNTRKVSENYLTGVRLTTTGHVRDGIVDHETERRERIPRSRVFLEDVVEDPDAG